MGNYFKEAQGDWMTQPAGMVPSWRGWPQGPIGPSSSYRMPPLTKMSGCGACGGLGQEAEDETGWGEPFPDDETVTGTYDAGGGATDETLTPAEKAAVDQKSGGGMGMVLLLGLGAVALWLAFGGKARRNPCHRNAAPPNQPRFTKRHYKRRPARERRCTLEYRRARRQFRKRRGR